MDYDATILQLLERIRSLEQRVVMLEKNDVPSVSVNKSTARDFAIEKLQTVNKQFTVQKGNRAIKADIVLRTDNTTLRVKLYYSKSRSTDHPFGWHVVYLDDFLVNKADIHMFSISFNNQYHTFLFTNDELCEYISRNKLKSAPTGAQFFFYFKVVGDKKIENRDDELDVSQYYERWELPSQLTPFTAPIKGAAKMLDVQKPS